MCCDTAGWVMQSSFAAFVKLRVSHAVRKVLTLKSSTSFSYPP